MLDEAFRKQRFLTVRELAEKAIDPFIKKRLFDLAARYDSFVARTPLTPVDLNFKSQGTGSEQ